MDAVVDQPDLNTQNLPDVLKLGHNKLQLENEKLIDEIKTIKDEKTDTITLNCSKRESQYFKQQHKSLKLKSSKKTEIKNKINSFIGSIDISRFLEIIDDEEDPTKKIKPENIGFEIKKFIYYSACIDSQVRKYIMRHYLLHFIKSHAFSKYKNTVLDFSSSTNEQLINSFLLKIGKYELIPYIYINITKNGNIKYSFSSCGETTLLNLLNYYFINDEGDFNIPDNLSGGIKKFYTIYHTMEKQLKDIEQTTKDWCEMVVSNLKKSDTEELEVRLYNYDGDIHNNIKNIIFVLKTILNSTKNDIKEILIELKKITGEEDEEDEEDEEEYDEKDNDKIKIIGIDDNEIEFVLDERYIVNFRPGHGEIHIKNDEEDERTFLYGMNINEDFCIIYNNVFKIDEWYEPEYYRQMISRNVFEILNNIVTIDNPIINIYLSNMKYLYLSGHASTLPETMFKLIKLKELDLSSNNLEKIPELIGNLINIEKLVLSDNKLIELPESIFKLDKLSTLILKSNNIEVLPNNIGNLSKLEKLILNDNNLTTLPDSIGNLSQLYELEVSGNKLTMVPDSIGNLTKLEHLSLGNTSSLFYYQRYKNTNQLTKLPNSIGNLTELKELNLNNNNLGILPDSIGNLAELKKLNLNNNKLTTLPDSISNLTKLKILKLSDNNLRTLPDSIGNLTQLYTLELSKNQLTILPDNIGKLTELHGLSLSYNNLTMLPESIGNLTQLYSLELSNNQLTILPESIGGLINLNLLYLTDNNLTMLPENMVKLTRLSWLKIFAKFEQTQPSTNQIKKLPDSIIKLIKWHVYHIKKMRPDIKIINLDSILEIHEETEPYPLFNLKVWITLYNEFKKNIELKNIELKNNELKNNELKNTSS
jgi:Leucine-rich repeat (LRR) protein